MRDTQHSSRVLIQKEWLAMCLHKVLVQVQVHITMTHLMLIGSDVIYMSDGVIEEIGTPEQVFDHPASEKTRSFLRGTQNF